MGNDETQAKNNEQKAASPQASWAVFFNEIGDAIRKRDDPLLIIDTADCALINHLSENAYQYYHSDSHPGWIALLEYAAEQVKLGEVAALRANTVLYPKINSACELARIAGAANQTLWLCAADDQTLTIQAANFFRYLPGWKLRFFIDSASHSDAIRPTNFSQAFEQCLQDRFGLKIPHTDEFPFVETVMHALTIGTRCDTSRTDDLLKVLSPAAKSQLAEIERDLRTTREKAEIDEKSTDPKTPEQTKQIQKAITEPRVWQSNIIRKLVEFFHPELARWAQSQDLLEDFYFACSRVANSDVAGVAPVWYASELLPQRLKGQLEDPDFCAWLRRFESHWNPPTPLALMDDSENITSFLLKLQDILRYKSNSNEEWSLSEGYRRRATIHMRQVTELISGWLKVVEDPASKFYQVRERLTLIRCLIPIVRYCPEITKAQSDQDKPQSVQDKPQVVKEEKEAIHSNDAKTQLTAIVKGLKKHLEKLFSFSWVEEFAKIQAALKGMDEAHKRVLQQLAKIKGGTTVVKESLGKAPAEECEGLILAIKSKLAGALTDLNRTESNAMANVNMPERLIKELATLSESAFTPCKATLSTIYENLDTFQIEPLKQFDSDLDALKDSLSKVNALFKEAETRWKDVEVIEKTSPSFEDLLKLDATEASQSNHNGKGTPQIKLDVVVATLQRALGKDHQALEQRLGQSTRTSNSFGNSLKALHAAETLQQMLSSETKDSFNLSEADLKALLKRLDSDLAALHQQVMTRRRNNLVLHTPTIDALEIEVLLLWRQLDAAIQQSKATGEVEKSQRRAPEGSNFARIERKIESLEAAQKRHPVIPVERVKLLRAELHESKDRYDLAINAYQALAEQCEYLHDPVLWRLAYYGALRCHMSARSLPEYAVLSRFLAFADVQDLRSKEIDRYRKGSGNLVIFPSFRGSIRAEVSALCASVRSLKEEQDGGLSLFIDHDRNESEDFDPVIYERLLSADIAIVFITEDYFSSPWCKAELTLLLQQNRFRGTQLHYVYVDQRSIQSNPLNTESQYFNNDRMDRLRNYGEKLVPEVIGRDYLVEKLSKPLIALITQG